MSRPTTNPAGANPKHENTDCYRSVLARLLDTYTRTREQTERLCKPLQTEDYVVQSMPDASPVRWHLAHAAWFFETFVLQIYVQNYRKLEPAFETLFNSYYNAVGEQFPRRNRGLLTRPTVNEIFQYRHHVDAEVARLLTTTGENDNVSDICTRIELGLHHEMQHQELILTDLKHMLSCNPMLPTYVSPQPPKSCHMPVEWVTFEEGLKEIGHEGNSFCYDNETPRHREFVPGHQLASRTVSSAEYLEFMRDKGYGRSELWLSEGWNFVRQNDIVAPLYWKEVNGEWHEFTLHGQRVLDPDAPVCHVSYFEADAFARWADARLPTEAEWETAAVNADLHGQMLDDRVYHPVTKQEHRRLPEAMFGNVWEWTASPYVAYPGYRPVEGALGEYNGKFMCNQFILKGGSCATARRHIRNTYRNFFSPDARWQFTGIRLARDC